MSHPKLQEEESVRNQRPEGLQDVALLTGTRSEGQRAAVWDPPSLVVLCCLVSAPSTSVMGRGRLKIPRIVSDLLPAVPQRLLRASQHPPGSVLSRACQYTAPPKCPRPPGAQHASHSAVWAKPSGAAHSVLVLVADVGGICWLSETSLLAGLCWGVDCLQPPPDLRAACHVVSACSPLSGKGFSKPNFPAELLLLLVTHCQFSAFRPELIQPRQPLASW